MTFEEDETKNRPTNTNGVRNNTADVNRSFQNDEKVFVSTEIVFQEKADSMDIQR